MPRVSLLLIAGLLLFFSCEKDTEIVTGNYPPPDNTVTDASYRQYINRCYIQVHGAEPDSSALNSSLALLKSADFSVASREIFLDTLFSKVAYKWQVFNTCRLDYLNNTDTTEMRNQLMLFTFLANDSSYIALWPILQYEIGRLQLLIDAGPAYAAGMITIRELHKRFIDNWFYDQINMGSAN